MEHNMFLSKVGHQIIGLPFFALSFTCLGSVLNSYSTLTTYVHMMAACGEIVCRNDMDFPKRLRIQRSESLPRKCLDLGSDGVILDFRESALLLGSHVSCVGQAQGNGVWATWDGFGCEVF